jgi:hypothetical protein
LPNSVFWGWNYVCYHSVLVLIGMWWFLSFSCLSCLRVWLCAAQSMLCSTFLPFLLLFFYFYCFIFHMCIQCLGHFSPLAPPHPLPPTPPPPSSPTPSIPGRNYFALISNFVEEHISNNRKEQGFLLVEIRIAILGVDSH